MNGKRGKNKEKTDNTTPDRCLGCQSELHTAGAIRNAGEPITYTPVFFCDNPVCHRYGLVSIYRVQGTGTR